MDCFNLKKGIISILIMISFSAAGLAQTGSIEGVVTDRNSKEATAWCYSYYRRYNYRNICRY